MKREAAHTRHHREHCHVREAFRAKNMWCQMECDQPATDTHEILNAANRQLTLDHPPLLLRLCRKHHDGIPSLFTEDMTATQKLAIQLCLKRAANDGTYNLEIVRLAWQALNGRQAKLIDESDVDAAEEYLKEQGIL